MARMFKWVLKLTPIQAGLLLILLPVFASVLYGIIYIVSFFMGYEFLVPLFEIAVFMMFGVFLLWTWAISVRINNKMLKINPRLFKISFFLFLAYILIDFLMSLELDLFKRGWYVDVWIITLVEIIVTVYWILVFVSYIYMGVFTGKVIDAMLVSKPKTRYMDKIPRFLLVLAFPLGIPLLQRQIQGYLGEHKLFGFKEQKRRYIKPNPLPPKEKVEENVVEKKEEIDKEDPRRFMPKPRKLEDE